MMEQLKLLAVITVALAVFGFLGGLMFAFRIFIDIILPMSAAAFLIGVLFIGYRFAKKALKGE